MFSSNIIVLVESEAWVLWINLTSASSKNPWWSSCKKWFWRNCCLQLSVSVLFTTCFATQHVNESFAFTVKKLIDFICRISDKARKSINYLYTCTYLTPQVTKRELPTSPLIGHNFILLCSPLSSKYFDKILQQQVKKLFKLRYQYIRIIVNFLSNWLVFKFGMIFWTKVTPCLEVSLQDGCLTKTKAMSISLLIPFWG